jgi:hypothetical protein
MIEILHLLSKVCQLQKYVVLELPYTYSHRAPSLRAQRQALAIMAPTTHLRGSKWLPSNASFFANPESYRASQSY